MRVIYIVGLNHSGTTILDLALSHHPSIIGLGEVYNVLREKEKSGENTKDSCSCGNTLKQCRFWSKYKNEGSFIEKYQQILTLAHKNKKNIIVDSSKRLESFDYLLKLHNSKDIDLRVIFIIKDARSWAQSLRNAQKRTQQHQRSYLTSFFYWHKHNKYTQTFLKNNKVPYCQIGYEELCFSTQQTLNTLLSFIGVSRKDFSLNNTPTTHIAYGNRTKLKQQQFTIEYNPQWTVNYALTLSFLALPHIFKWNKNNTYGNVK